MIGKIGLGRGPALKPGYKIKITGIVSLLMTLCLVNGWAYGQTFGEFFNQKKTQRKYFVEQMAALKVYAGYLQKGYQIGRDGVQAVRDITSGEFGLHDAFISSLSKVSPLISRHKKVAEVIGMQLEMLSVFRSLGRLEGLDPMAMAYIASIGGGLLESSVSDVELLLTLVTSGRLELDDQERLRRLEELHASVEEKCRFSRWFRDQVMLLKVQRDDVLGGLIRIGGLHEK